MADEQDVAAVEVDSMKQGCAAALGATATTATAATHNVSVLNDGTVTPTWDPPILNIAAGDTVTWTWAGFHNVQSGNGGTPCSSTAPNFCSGSTSVGGTFSHTFTSAGSFPYVCFAHVAQGMTGEIIVAAAAVPSMTPIGLGATLVILSGLGFAWRQRRSQSAG